MIGRVVRFLDQRARAAPLLRKQMRYLFPDHWSFLLGEVALYAFIVLIATGTYLALFYRDSTVQVVYHGGYAPLQGQKMSEAYRSVLDLSTSVKAGLLIRQTHHWAANVFLAAIVLHLLRVFFTGAYRKPRELTYWIGVTILGAALLEGFLGYSLVDDLLSGMGLAIGNAVLLSVPFVGANLAQLLWGGVFPGTEAFFARMYIAHVFLIPGLIAALLVAHLALVALRHHTQFPGRRQSERKIVGMPTFPGQTPRSLGLLLATAAVLVLLGGLVQINPIWLWGPYHPYLGTNGAQPDWYLGWLIGALRMVPGFDWTIGDYTLVPNAFWGGALLPTMVFGFLYLWPLVERLVTGDRSTHNLLQRPRDAPVRTGLGVAVVADVLVVFLAGSADRVAVRFGISYDGQIWFYRVMFFLAPLVFGLVAYRVCRELQGGEHVAVEREEAIADARAANRDAGRAEPTAPAEAPAQRGAS